MARKQQPRRRPPSAPAPAGSAANFRTADSTAPRRYPSTAAAPATVSATEDLSESYAHVKRDLTRIVILGAVLLVGIYLSQFIAL
jgi:hypothetical protein